MPSYYLSDGSKQDKKKIDRLISEAKRKFWKEKELDGFISCNNCNRTDQSHYDVSHIVSVNDCQRNAETEKAYSLDNLEILCRTCHLEHESKSKFI